MIDLISTVLPTKERNLAFHLESFEITLYTMKLYLFWATSFCFRGKPKYFPKLEVSKISSKSQISSLMFEGTLGEK